MEIIIYFILGISGFFFRSKLLMMCQLINIYILIAFNNGGPDYGGYQAMYEIFSKIQGRFISLKGGILYHTSIYYLSKIGLNLENITLILTTLTFIIGIYLVKKLQVKNLNFLISCIYFFPGIDYVIQKRNFYAMGILSLSFYKLYKNRKLEAFILLILSYYFHSSILFYFIIFGLVLLDNKRIEKIIIIDIVLGIFLIPIFLKYLVQYNILSNEIIIVYFKDISNRLPLGKVAVFIIIHLVMFFIIKKVYKKIKNKKRYDIFIYKLNLTLLCIIPFYYYNATFFRLYRNIFFLNYIFFANYLWKKRDYTIKGILMIYILGLCCILYLFFGGLKYNGLVKPLFENNIIFNKF